MKFLNLFFRSFEETFVDEVVRVVSFTSCLEFSKISGKIWSFVYLLLRQDDIKLLTPKRDNNSGQKTDNSRIKTNNSGHKTDNSRHKTDNSGQNTGSKVRKSWKVLYSSGPIVDEESAFIFSGVRAQITPSSTSLDSISGQTRFLRLPVTRWSNFPPGRNGIWAALWNIDAQKLH